ncbi:MAG: hypothetical protein ACP5N9_00070, partial [Candidatus Bilamarchaeum sp.]
GNIQQNGSLSMTGAGTWGANYVVTDTTYDRSLSGLEMEADVTCTAGSSIMGIGYGDPGVLTGGGESCTMVFLNIRLEVVIGTQVSIHQSLLKTYIKKYKNKLQLKDMNTQ